MDKQKFMKNQPDYTLLSIIALLVVIGFLMLASATAPLAYNKFEDSYWFVKHQFLVGLLPGLVLFFLLSKIDYRKLKKISLWLFLFSLVLLVMVFVPGIGAPFGKAKSWLYIGGFSLQPSEIVKLTLIIYLAAWLAKDREGPRSFTHDFVPFLGILGSVCLLIALQPDLGTLLLIGIIAVAVYYLGGGRLWHIGLLSGLGVAGLITMIKIAPYRMQRFTSFLNPELDPQGISYHINQALLAVGSGGFFGRGFGQSRQKFLYLPEVAGDSIFAIMAEEVGFIVSVAFVALFVFLVYRGVKIARQVPDDFGRLLVLGIVSWFSLQAFINISGMVGLLPITGIPLPFISYGGTALMTTLAAAGILVGVSRA